MTNFLLDTNVILYRGGSANGYNVDDFWNNTLPLEENDICVPREVEHELQVQYFQLEAQGKHDLVFLIRDRIIPSLDILDIPESTEAEQVVKLASSYLCTKYNIMKPVTSKNANPGRWWNEYPGISDARILLTALYFDYDLVTFNIKDFMLLLVMGKDVWNPIDNCKYPPIDSSIQAQINNDSRYLNYKRIIEDFINSY
ncbi:hypothetical protein [Priestia megaterium]|uniref:hypothetical protein n=1 Tax=Priestia megaterium TaxID=1404 RepID=UPI002E1AD820|nr:hypothetical protein [Priestia megaterium]